MECYVCMQKVAIGDASSVHWAVHRYKQCDTPVMMGLKALRSFATKYQQADNTQICAKSRRFPIPEGQQCLLLS